MHGTTSPLLSRHLLQRKARSMRSLDDYLRQFNHHQHTQKNGEGQQEESVEFYLKVPPVEDRRVALRSPTNKFATTPAATTASSAGVAGGSSTATRHHSMNPVASSRRPRSRRQLSNESPLTAISGQVLLFAENKSHTLQELREHFATGRRTQRRNRTNRRMMRSRASSSQGDNEQHVLYSMNSFSCSIDSESITTNGTTTVDAIGSEQPLLDVAEQHEQRLLWMADIEEELDRIDREALHRLFSPEPEVVTTDGSNAVIVNDAMTLLSSSPTSEQEFGIGRRLRPKIIERSISGHSFTRQRCCSPSP